MPNRVTRAIVASLLTAVGAAGCGGTSGAPSTGSPAASGSPAPAGGPAARSATSDGGSVALHGHAQAVDPVAGAAASASTASSGSAPASAAAPLAAASAGAAPQPLSDAEIRRQLAESGIAASANQATLVPGGLAVAPVTAPTPVDAIINAGNTIARLPYRFGGGHGTFEDSEYDCSGSLSFVLAAAGLLGTTMTSGDLMSWGDPGPGKWVTIFANPGHTFMYVAGLRFDTVALAETGSRWSNRSATERDGFAVRHPHGL